jgi:hypothetical protein
MTTAKRTSYVNSNPKLPGIKSGKGGPGLGQGRKPKWQHQPTDAIRVPQIFMDDLVDIAIQMDKGLYHRAIAHPKTEEAIVILQSALSLKPNAGGAIKEKIRQALAVLNSK